MRVFTAALAIFGLIGVTNAEAAIYKVDTDHSSVTFKVKHLLTSVTGTFNTYEGTIEYELGKPEVWKAEGTIQTASIDTRHQKRDTHLKSADFFGVEMFPVIEFKSTGVVDATDKTAKLNGLFKMHGVEKPITLDVQIHGIATDPWGNTKAAFTGMTKINRKDYGINWNQALDNGGVLVGEEVEITLEIEATLQS